MNNESKKAPTELIKVGLHMLNTRYTQGFININGHDRLSDFVNKSDLEFIPLCNCTLFDKDGEAFTHNDYMLINKKRIIHICEI